MHLYHLLVNGSPTMLFKASRGFRQGDPLSPFLFSIVVEALSVLLVRAREEGLINGFMENRYGEAMSHLQFVNNTILFGSTSREEILALKRILRCFQLVSNLKIKISKSWWWGLSVRRRQLGLWQPCYIVNMRGLPLYIWSSYWGKAEV